MSVIIKSGASSNLANVDANGSLQIASFNPPNIFKTASATASGNTALWTPTSGKKFTLMRFIIDGTANIATSGGAVITVSFQDASSATNIAFDIFAPSSAVTTTQGGYSSGWIDLGPTGYVSTTANNVLNINLSAALSAGNVRVTACGIEQ